MSNSGSDGWVRIGGKGVRIKAGIFHHTNIARRPFESSLVRMSMKLSSSAGHKPNGSNPRSPGVYSSSYAREE